MSESMVDASYQQPTTTQMALRDWFWLALALLCILGLIQWGWPSPDGRYFIHEAKTFLTTGSLAHDVTWADWQAFHGQGSDGKFYGLSNEMTMVLTLAPFIWLAQLLYSIVPSLGESLSLYAVCSLHNVLATLGCGLVMGKITQSLGLSRRQIVASALLLVVATPLMHYGARLYREPLLLLSFLVGVLALLKLRKESRSFFWWAFWGLGVFLTWTLRATDALILLTLPLALLRKNSWKRPVLQLVLGAAALATAIAALNLWQHVTAPGRGTLHSESLSGGIFRTMFQNINGSEGLKEWADRPVESGWWVPLMRLAGLLMAPGKGILWFGLPLVIGAVVAARRFGRSDAARLALASGLLSLLGYSLYSAWFTGAWGPRLLLAGWALGMPVFVTWGCENWQTRRAGRRAMMVGILALSTVVGVAGATVNDRADNESAPSHVANTTRLDQAWQPRLSPVLSQTRRLFTPSFSEVTQSGLIKGKPTARAQVTQGWVVWWSVLWRAGLYRTGVAFGFLALLAGLAAALWRIGRRLADAESARGAGETTSPHS